MRQFERGEIRNPAFITQPVDFRGLKYGAITPTDIDGLIDFGGEATVILEFKHKNAKRKIAAGQRRALEALYDTHRAAYRDILILLAEHEHPSHEPIDAANAIVFRFYRGGEWISVAGGKTVRQWVDHFHRKIQDGEAFHYA